MSTVYFSGACQDENGKYSGGAAGDQTGKEIRTTKAYTHNLGWRIFRYPDSKVAYWIGTNAYNIAANDNYGYDQGQRNTGYTLAIKAGYEPKNVKTKCELDCSSMVRTCVSCALEKEISDFNTSTEPAVLLKLGFKEITGAALTELQLGDVVCTPSKGHTEIVSKVVTNTTSTSSDTYYPKYTGNSTSITAALKAVGETDTSLTHRKTIGTKNGISNVGTASGNTAMLTKLKNGTLKKA